MASMEEAGEAARADEANGFTEEQMSVIMTQVLGKTSAQAHALMRCAADGQRHVTVRNVHDTLELGWSEGLYSLRIQGWRPE